MIKAIIFDCFGVLTVDLWKEFVSTLPEDQKQPARDINHTYDAGFIDEKQFLDEIKELTGRHPGEVEDLSLSTREATKNEELLNYIAGLKPHYKIGLLSNIASDWIRSSLLSAEEQKLFDQMILSFEVGMTKPDPRIFMLACERLRVGPHETVMVDDIETYCQAAQGEGLKAVVYRDFPQLKRDLTEILSRT